MVLKLDCSSEIGAHMWGDLGYLIWLFNLFRSRTVTHQKRSVFLTTYATCSKLPSDISTMEQLGQTSNTFQVIGLSTRTLVAGLRIRFQFQ